MESVVSPDSHPPADIIQIEESEPAENTKSTPLKQNSEICMWLQQEHSGQNKCVQDLSSDECSISSSDVISGVKRLHDCDSMHGSQSQPSPKHPKEDKGIEEGESQTENNGIFFQFVDSTKDELKAADMAANETVPTDNELPDKAAIDEVSNTDDVPGELPNNRLSQVAVSPERNVLHSDQIHMTSILPQVPQNGEALNGNVSLLYGQCSGGVSYPAYEQFRGALDTFTSVETDCPDKNQQFLAYSMDQYQTSSGSCIYTDAIRTLENLSASFPNTNDFNYAFLELSGLKGTLPVSSLPDQASLIDYSSHNGQNTCHQEASDTQAYDVNVSEGKVDMYTEQLTKEDTDKILVLEHNPVPAARTGYQIPQSTSCVLTNSSLTQETLRCQSGALSTSTPIPSESGYVTCPGREVLSTWKIGKGPVIGDQQKPYSTPQTPAVLDSNERRYVSSDMHILTRPSSTGCTQESALSSASGTTRSSLSSEESPLGQERIGWFSNKKETNIVPYGGRIYAPTYTLKPVPVSRETPRYQLRNISSLCLNSSGSEEGFSPQEPIRLTYTPHNTPVEDMSHSPVITTIPGPEQLNAALQRAKENLNPDTDMGRHAHNAKERARRARIKTACENLRDVIPGMNCKTDKATVFEFAVEYIKYLRHAAGGDRFRSDKEFLRQLSPYCE